ncbi:MAG TPA: hypothetical protein VKQ30_24575 [Ktedonobacterales bacterium]|nr:hypothetical protein [Ktedonobacterales bacterium]
MPATIAQIGRVEDVFRAGGGVPQQEAYAAYFHDRLEAAFQQAGIPTSPSPFQIWPFHSFMIVPQQR